MPKQFVKFPVTALATSLSNTDIRILLTLLLNHFHFCGNDYSKEFYLCDRDLSQLTGCSSRSVWFAKHHLKFEKLIDFRRGPKNKTWYKILM